jgi:fluoride exporter
MQTTLLIGLGGFFGTLARYGFGVGIAALLSGRGWATFIVNIVGSFLIGFIYQLSLIGRVQNNILPILTIGFLGGFTTFSAFSLDAVQYLRDERYLSALGYVGAMLICGLFATYIGVLLGIRLEA